MVLIFLCSNRLKHTECLHFASLWPDVGKSVEYVCEVLYWQLPREMLATVNSPIDEICDASVALTFTHVVRRWLVTGEVGV